MIAHVLERADRAAATAQPRAMAALFAALILAAAWKIGAAFIADNLQ